MPQFPSTPRLPRDSLIQGAALACLLVMGALVLVGPSGLLAWSENQTLLEQRRAEIVALREERDELRNRVALLDPGQTDPDLAGELLRRNLNVVHPDELVMLID